MPLRLSPIPAPGYESVVLCEDRSAGYRGIIAIHDLTLGPAVGGIRFRRYPSEDDALADVLRLARSMTYKSALAGLALGGGKSVILGDPTATDRETLLRLHGRAIHELGGQYIGAPDSGTGPQDMEIVLEETPFVAGLLGRSGDPAPMTARGVFRSIQASATHRWGSSELRERTVAVQGCGNVGRSLARELRDAGAKLIVADVDPDRARAVAEECDARVVRPGDVHHVAADVFSPCAYGGMLNDQTIPALRCEIVAGAANNQLLEDRHGDALHERAILYAPDYLANAGGVVNGTRELLGWSPERAAAAVEGIYDTALRVFALATERGIAPHRAADMLAERFLGRG